MTDEKRIGQAGDENVMEPSPAAQGERAGEQDALASEQGIGRREEARSNVYPMSGEVLDEEMPARTPAEWGQGVAGPAGYEDSGSSELTPPDKTGDEPA